MPTRSSKTRAAADVDAVASDTPTTTLGPCEENPPQLFILPQDASVKARFYTLPNPATSKPNRYFYCPEHGLYEFMKTSSLPSSLGSFLIAQDIPRDISQNEVRNTLEKQETDMASERRPIADGYVLEDADIFVATPFDLLFLLIPTFEDLNFFERSTFRQEDDFLEKLTCNSTHMRTLLYSGEFRNSILKRLRAVSDIQELGEETLYRPSTKLLFQEILDKASRAVEFRTWPTSLEEHEIRKAIDIPSLPTLTEENPRAETEPLTETDERLRDTNTQVAQMNSEQSPALPPNELASEQTKHLFRLHNAITLILQSYLPRTKAWSQYISDHITSNEQIDFRPMEQHQASVKKRKDELQALRSLSDNISRKRNVPEDDEAAEARAEKKRKKEEEEKRKKSESRALKDLKKTDTSGMKKLSSFFSKAQPKVKG